MKHAIVVGAGFAGLLAARVLSEHCGRVTLVERDHIDADTAHRSGVPQAHHPHALLARGAQVLEDLFPGLRAELSELGAVVADVGSEFKSRAPAGWAPRDAIGIEVQSVTRVTLERTVRRRVLEIPSVSVVGGVRVDGLVHENGRVVGIHGRHRDAGADFTEHADLVVVASGRTSKLVDWLKPLGVHCPPQQVVDGHLAYTSRLYHVDEDLKFDWLTAYEITHAPHTKRGGAVSTVDGKRWFVTLFGAGGDIAPTDEHGFLEYAGTLECRDVADIVKNAEPASSIYRFANLGSKWNRFDKVRDWPRGLIALGDTVCAMNPVYGHGLTLAALGAEILGKLLPKQNIERRFQRKLARVVGVPWLTATTTDLGWHQGHLPWYVRAQRWYGEKLFAVIPGNPHVYRRFIRTSQMVDHPATLFHPALVATVIRGLFR
ncbi:FAD-dependent oxidoreductase [Lentzea tibetensis]|uniref:FAD-dependent oxidoreductase n=1 Tax=Lentzea tibetensis TaxID=2591470 RepID=A0A563ESP0_9PSEU|nr:FAD-dependent monooxygenase [Lentzea tibetensis]TWP50622.1 FAD-dependent oxidoreductase [Lentzea tibetensis]